MKKIVILRCLRSEENCTGAACFQAFNERSCQFARYGDAEIQLVAFMAFMLVFAARRVPTITSIVRKL